MLECPPESTGGQERERGIVVEDSTLKRRSELGLRAGVGEEEVRGTAFVSMSLRRPSSLDVW